MTDTIVRLTRTTPSQAAKYVKVFQNPEQAIEFEDGYIHYIHAAALERVTRLDVHGLKNAQIHFLGPFKGNVLYEGAFRHDSGVANFVDCEDLLVGGLHVFNERTFSPGNLTTETSCAVNVQKSRMRFERGRFDAMGKIALQVHSDSYVELDDMQLNAYYFELFVAASEVVGDRVRFVQAHAQPDSHSAVLVNSSMRQAITNTLYENTKVTLRDCIFDMETGRSIVSGNGSYHTRSEVFIERPTFLPNRDPHFGICAYHENFNSITVQTDLGTIDPLTGEPIQDFISTPTTGFARYISHYDPDSRPGQGTYQNDDEPAPLRVDGLSSDDVWNTINS